MKAKIRIVAGLLLVAISAAGSQMAAAAQVSCNTTSCTTPGIGVVFNITIPGVLRFQVGDTSATAPTVNWTTAVTTANVGNSTALNPDSITLPGAGASGNQVVYQLISNWGGTNVTVAAAATTANGPTCTTPVSCGATFIPWSEIVLGNTGSLSNPAIGGSTTAPYGGSVINVSGFWTYQYANTTVPLQGNYSGTVTYTAADD